ncbi:glycosyltransferase family 2 protein [Trichothermofontia sp.]
MLPLVTIAIPTYQRFTYLQTAVKSALAQTYPHLEILISQDPTPNGLDPDIRTWSQTLASQNPHVRYRANACTLGLAGNWNAAADAAQGDYIVIIGDDDTLLPTFIETLVNAAQTQTQVIFANHYIINSEGDRLLDESVACTRRYHRDQMSAGPLDSPERWVWQNAIPLVSALIRTDAVRRLRFKEDLNTPEIELFLRLAHEGAEFVFVPEYLAEYRVHSYSATAGGLRSDRLVNYLVPFPVAPEIESYKQAFLDPCLVHAVHLCLLDGRKEQAQTLIESAYYSLAHTQQRKRLVQKTCAYLPGTIGIKLYQSLHAAKQKIKRIVH